MSKSYYEWDYDWEPPQSVQEAWNRRWLADLPHVEDDKCPLHHENANECECDCSPMENAVRHAEAGVRIYVRFYED